MAYSKTTWSSGDTITAAKLNNMESGISDNADDITAINQSLSDINVPTLRLSGGDGTSLSSGDDLNNYTACGTYLVLNNTVAQGIENMPASYGGTIWVLRPTGQAVYSVQIMLTYNLKIYARRYSSSTWYDWQTIL